MDWSKCVATFVKVAANKSFSEAAKQLHTTSPTITKRLQWLESYLGINLLSRTTRSVELTEEGQSFLHQVLPIFHEWENLKKSTFKGKNEIEGTLRIASTPYFGRIFLMPALKKFQEAYPKIIIEYFDSISGVNLIDEQLDLYIGLEKFIKSPATSIAVPLKEDYYQCYAAQSYIDKYGNPAHPADLSKHHCVVLHTRKNWELNNQQYCPRAYFSCSHSETLLEAAKLGMGIVNLPKNLTADYIQKHDFQTVLPEYQSKPFKIYASYPKLPFQLKRISAFIDFLKEQK